MKMVKLIVVLIAAFVAVSAKSVVREAPPAIVAQEFVPTEVDGEEFVPLEIGGEEFVAPATEFNTGTYMYSE